MKMKKISAVLSLSLVSSVVIAPSVWANEGVALLKADGDNASCFVSSVYIDGTYKVLATCRNLKTALMPEQNRYVVWLTDEDGKVRRLGEIQNGKMLTGTDARFTDLFVTAEADGYGFKPSDSVLLSGSVKAIDFGNGGVEALVTPEQKKAEITPTPVISETQEDQNTPSKGLSAALSTILKIALFGFGALLLIVGAFSFISRRKSL